MLCRQKLELHPLLCAVGIFVVPFLAPGWEGYSGVPTIAHLYVDPGLCQDNHLSVLCEPLVAVAGTDISHFFDPKTKVSEASVISLVGLLCKSFRSHFMVAQSQ